MKKTVIIGASPNPGRYSFLAANDLSSHHHEFVPLGIKKGEVLGKAIIDIRTKPQIDDVDTVTMYVRPELQTQWQDYIIQLNPKRIIFNPGTENPAFEDKAESAGIEVVEACTLVMLRTGQF